MYGVDVAIVCILALEFTRPGGDLTHSTDLYVGLRIENGSWGCAVFPYSLSYTNSFSHPYQITKFLKTQITHNQVENFPKKTVCTTAAFKCEHKRNVAKSFGGFLFKKCLD